MTALTLPAIDWTQPWLRPWRGAGEPVARALAEGVPLPEALNQAGPAPVRFVPQSELPPGQAYEDCIFHSGRCPVRWGLHDFFNGLCWLRFPHTKRRLNQLQAAAIAAQGIQATRGVVRDALTLFDENGAVLHAPPALWDALNAKDWHRLFVTLRPLWADARLLLFGHALLEKLVSPRKPMVAHVYRASLAIDLEAFGPADLSRLDGALAADLSAYTLASKPFAPLPVLGVPGWWAANEAPGFYDDVAVFRPATGTLAARQ